MTTSCNVLDRPIASVSRPGRLCLLRRIPESVARATWIAIFLSLWSGCSTPDLDSPNRVAFVVDMRAAVEEGWFDPDNETVGVRGDSAPLSWNESIIAADPDLDFIYEVAIELDEVSEDGIVFKFKVNGENNPNDGWQSGSNRWLELKDSHRYEATFEQPPRPRPTTFTGTVQQHPDFGAEGSDLKQRTLFVYLPPGYSASTERYPVLYMQDGRNVFDGSEVGAEWRMDETAERLIGSGTVNPFIIVGVGNTADRMREYTPSRPAGAENGGGGYAYGSLLVNGIKPFVDATYRTRADRSNTALGGSSLGGLISLFVGLEFPDVFGQLLLVSPSVWWDGGFILKEVRARDRSTNQRIWLYMGGEEGAEMLKGARDLRDLLELRGWNNETLEYSELQGATHSERAWANQSENMLRFLYARSDVVAEPTTEN